MLKIRKSALIALSVLICAMVLCLCNCYAVDVNSPVIKAGISIEHVPDALYGTWRVTSRLKETNAAETFKPVSADIWNLSRTGDVITLSNPFTGAVTEVTLEYVNDHSIRFTRTSDDRNDGSGHPRTGGHTKITETIGITIEGDKFTGVDAFKLETFSIRDVTKLYKTETALYNLVGERISGESIMRRGR